jgi:hypothetical protein
MDAVSTRGDRKAKRRRINTLKVDFKGLSRYNIDTI